MNTNTEKRKNQVKSKFYYMFWGIATTSVVLGQLYVGTGYRIMTQSIIDLTEVFTLIREGNELKQNNNIKQLRIIVSKLYQIMVFDEDDQRNFESNIIKG